MTTRLLGALRGSLRMTGLLLLLVFGAWVVWFVSLAPLRWRGAPLSSWLTVRIARAALRIIGVDIAGDGITRLATHRGFIFPNHQSYLDIVVLLALAPVRFVADKRVEDNPLTRRFGRALDVLFVDLFDKRARTEARRVIADSADYPPIVLFPEGEICPGTEIRPLRHGAFDIAIRAGHPVLPVLIRYQPHALIYWSIHDGSIVASLWRVLCERKRKLAEVTLLPPFVPGPLDEPVALSLTTRAAMQAAQLENATSH